MLWFKTKKCEPVAKECEPEKKCEHNFEREVSIEGYQFCSKCNAARYVCAMKAECIHKWENVDKLEVFHTRGGERNITEKIYVMKCSVCGDMKELRIGV